jgi:ATP-dependent Clp protease ATP-binding subunit ClpB
MRRLLRAICIGTIAGSVRRSPVHAKSVSILDSDGGPVHATKGGWSGGVLDALRPADEVDVGDDGLCSAVFLKDVGKTHEILSTAEGLQCVNQSGSAGITPLQAAILAQHRDLALLLLNKGADPFAVCDAAAKDSRGAKLRQAYCGYRELLLRNQWSALILAVLTNQPGMLELLVEHCGPEPNTAQLKQLFSNPAVALSLSSRKSFESALDNGLSLRLKRRRAQRLQFPLESFLKESLVGQREAIHQVSSAVRRKESGWMNEDKPLVMLFMGSSGIGKTETAKIIARYLHDGIDPAGGEKANSTSTWMNCFIRMDMSEYQHRHEVAKFIGAPPGYVGYNEGGQLTEKLKKCPKNPVVLLDEVEKAHPDVLTVMLQAFDEGRVTDGQGKTVDCRDATFIMTSNLAQRELAEEAIRIRMAAQIREDSALSQQASLAQKKIEVSATQGSTTVLRVPINLDKDDGTPTPSTSITESFSRNVVHAILRQHFGRDEFIGRINEIVYFLPFTPSEQVQLSRLELEQWSQRAKKKHEVDLRWEDGVAEVAAKGYDVRYGARSIKYSVDRALIAPIAQMFDEGLVKAGSTVSVGIEDAKNELVLTVDADPGITKHGSSWIKKMLGGGSA